MNCVACDRPLARHEQPQPTLRLGRKCWPPALCDGCARANVVRYVPPDETEAAEPRRGERGAA